MEKGRGGALARVCWKKIKRKAKRREARDRWEEEKKEFMEERSWKLEEVKGLREKGQVSGDFCEECCGRQRGYKERRGKGKLWNLNK